MQLDRHAKLALEYWTTYRPQALQELGDSQKQLEFFYVLGLRVTERVGELTDDLLEQVPAGQRARQRMAVRAQATEIIYAEEIYLPKEEGTEHREM
ncbi:hypothetical protein ACNPQM_21480 [Streptomyces sp. NPDC056231]|uniref:hypothetical protein n=1 Tax=Streptomyces sp. NPDC056231 TaxID=3345755 RepID=UPI003AADD7E1